MNFTAEDQLVFEFLRCFAALEFDMKRGGFLTGDERAAFPDWNAFSNSLDDEGALNASELRNDPDVEYLLSHPPKKQVVAEGKLCWMPLEQGDGEHETAWLVRIVKTTRNNLFHGGKFVDGPMTDPARDPTLLKGAVALIRAMSTRARFDFI